MELRIKRSNRKGGALGTGIVFTLDARLQLTPEEDEKVRRYKLGKKIIYNSAASRAHLEKAARSAEAKSYFNSLISQILGKVALTITIDGLCRGKYIEANDLNEILDAEDACRQACTYCRDYLETVASFTGEEQVFEF